MRVAGKQIIDDGHTLVLYYKVVVAIRGDLDNTQEHDIDMANADLKAAIQFGINQYLPAASDYEVLALEITE